MSQGEPDEANSCHLQDLPWQDVACWLKEINIHFAAIEIARTNKVDGQQLAGMSLEDMMEDSKMAKLEAKRVQQRMTEMIQIVWSVTAHSLSMDSSLNASYYSEATTDENGNSASDSDDSPFVAVAIKHPGESANFQKNIRGVIKDLLRIMGDDPPSDAVTETFIIPISGSNAYEMTFCMLVWTHDAADAAFDPDPASYLLQERRTS